MSKYKNYIGGILVFVIFVVGSIFGLACCGIHSLMSLVNQSSALFNNIYEGIQSAFWIEIILLVAMLATIGIISALFLAKKANKLKS